MCFVPIIKREFLSLCVIFIIPCLFFGRLLFSTPQMLVTPDFGRNDSWDFSMATKYFYWESLHNGQLPFWSPEIGDGFPILGEGQTGIFFIQNLVLYATLPFVYAYNLSLISSLIIFALGIYGWLRWKRFNRYISLLSSLTLLFSGMVIPQLTHLALIQALSLLPWIMWISEILTKEFKQRYFIVFIFLLSQQILTGFPQAVAITLIGATLNFILLVRLSRMYWKKYGLYLLGVIFSLGLSSVQLVPSFEFLRETNVAKGFSLSEVLYFSYPISHLLTFINPFIFGHPRFGTYPPFNQNDGSIFWETSTFFGWWPLVGIILVIVFWSKMTKSDKNDVKGWVFITLIALGMMLGKNSPIYLIFTVWPLNQFRVPARFMWLFLPGIIMLSSIGWAKGVRYFQKKPILKIGYFLIGIFSLGYIVVTWYNYHLILTQSIWYNPPQIISYIVKNNRIFSLFSEAKHNEFFLLEGWDDPKPYIELRNQLQPNSNLIWGLQSHGIYAGRFLRRSSYMDSLLLSEIKDSSESAEVSDTGNKLLRLFSIKQLLSSKPIFGKGLVLDHIEALTRTNTYLYHVERSLPQVYLSREPIIVETLVEAEREFKQSEFQPGKHVLVEEKLPVTPGPVDGLAEIRRYESNNIDIEVWGNTSSTLLVLTDTLYPGWKAYIDGKITSIYPANLKHRLVIIPAGNHKVVFEYKPKSFFYGAAISGICLTGMFGILIFVKIRKKRN